MDLCTIYMTFGSGEEAAKIARILVKEQLAACVNLLPGVQSVYRWQGKVEEAIEVAAFAKTRETLVDRLILRVKELHSYECPCIVAFRIEKGYAGFLKWIEEETREG